MAHTIFLIFWVIDQLLILRCAAEPDFSISGILPVFHRKLSVSKTAPTFFMKLRGKGPKKSRNSKKMLKMKSDTVEGVILHDFAIFRLYKWNLTETWASVQFDLGNSIKLSKNEIWHPQGSYYKISLFSDCAGELSWNLSIRAKFHCESNSVVKFWL